MGKVTGSKEIQARGEDDQAKGKARETVADVQSDLTEAVKDVKRP